MATLTLTVLRCPESVTAEQRHIQGGALTVGRGTECDWPLADPLKSLSRKHCTLEFVGGCWHVRDLSTNGTFVNFSTAPIGRDQAQQLVDGDRLRLGAYEIEVAISQTTFMPSGPSDLDPSQSPFALPPAGSPHPGFAAARLPGLDDPVPRSEAHPFGGRPDPQPAMQDHAASAADAFVPPAAAAPGKPIIPDDWYHDLLPPQPPPPQAAPRAPVAPPISAFDELLAPLPAPLPAPPPARVPPAVPVPVPAPVSAPVPAATPRVPAPPPPQPVADDWDHPTPAPAAPARTPVPAMPMAFAAPAVAPVMAPVPDPVHVPPAAFAAQRAAEIPRAREPDAPGALLALLAGADLPPEMAARAMADPEAALRMAGALLRASVAGVRALLIARGTVKREFRIEQTMLRVADNNPLKFAASDEQALAALIDPRSPALWAMRESIDDLTLHQVAALAATQAAAKALLEKLAPAEIEAEEPASGGLFSGGREKKLWEAYKRRHTKLLEQFEDDFESAFGTAFARAYEQAAERAPK